MSHRIIKWSDLEKVIEEEMTRYTVNVNDAAKEAIKTVAKNDVKQLKNSSAQKFGNGPYAKGWRNKLWFDSVSEYRAVVYNSMYRLTHLLEFGHVKWLWGKKTNGFVKGWAHIRPVADKADEEVVKELKARLE